MFLLYRLRRLHLIHYILLGLLALRLAYFLLERAFGIELSWTISRLLILKYIPWFALGISIYLAISRHDVNAWRQPAITAACAVLTLLIVDTLSLAVLAIALGYAVFLAANNRARVLRYGILVWLGSISYPLYLLHENIGWSLQLRFAAWGIPADARALAAVAASLAIAAMLTRWIEQPAMRWIRSAYRKRQVMAQ